MLSQGITYGVERNGLYFLSQEYIFHYMKVFMKTKNQRRI